MSEITLFNHDQFGQIRTIADAHGEPWFVAKDVCDALDIKNTTQAMSRLEENERAKLNIGRQGDTNIINESGLYELVFQSRKKEAKEFKSWIKKDILPSIRKTGSYVNPDSVSRTDLAKMIIESEAEKEKLQIENKALETEVEKLQPAKNFYEAIARSKQNIRVGTFAKLISNAGIIVGRNTLFQWLRSRGYLMRNNEPKQHTYRGKPIFTVIEFKNEKTDRIDSVTLITPHGQQYLFEKWCEFHDLNHPEIPKPELIKMEA